jgi:hypothetical protein
MICCPEGNLTFMTMEFRSASGISRIFSVMTLFLTRETSEYSASIINGK